MLDSLFVKICRFTCFVLNLRFSVFILSSIISLFLGISVEIMLFPSFLGFRLLSHGSVFKDDKKSFGDLKSLLIPELDCRFELSMSSDILHSEFKLMLISAVKSKISGSGLSVTVLGKKSISVKTSGLKYSAFLKSLNYVYWCHFRAVPTQSAMLYIVKGLSGFLKSHDSTAAL